jgi:hypothetical protein
MTNNKESLTGEGLLSDIFIKPFKAKKRVSIEKLDTNVGLYASMCMESYNQSKANPVIGAFNKDPSFSQTNCVVYTVLEKKNAPGYDFDNRKKISDDMYIK